MSTASEMYQLYLDAEKKILSGQTVRMGERTLTMADLEQIRAGRIEWERRALTEGKRPGPARATFA